MVGTSTYATEAAQQKVLNHLLGRPQKTGDIKVESVAKTLKSKGSPIDYYDIVKTFRQMEDAGMGRLIVGRRGGITRFRWGVNGKHQPVAPTPPVVIPAAGQVTITITLDANSSLLDIFRHAVVTST